VAILTLADAKAELGKTTSADDAQVQTYCDAVTTIITDYIRGPVEDTTYTGHFTPTGSKLLLEASPLLSVTSVTLWDGVTPHVLAQAADPSAGGDYAYLIDSAAIGLLQRIGADGRGKLFNGCRVTVVYHAGYASVPAAINEAARKIVVHNWAEHHRGARPANPVTGPANRPTAPFSPLVGLKIPPTAEVLLEAFRRGGGIA
jgi:hypothetical protein